MSGKGDGCAAFPSAGVVIDCDKNEHKQGAYEGMSLRDYFAGKFAAAQAVTTSADRDFIKPYNNYPEGLTVAERIAQVSYQLADAMLAERAK